MKEGFGYLRQQPVVLALGTTLRHPDGQHRQLKHRRRGPGQRHSSDSGALGFGFIEAVWAVGAITGGLITSQLPQKIRLPLYVAVMAGLALWALAVPYVTFLVGAVCCRAVSGFFARSGESWRQSHSWRLCHATSWGVRNRHSLFCYHLQLAMSFSLGWIAQRFSIAIGFFFAGGNVHGRNDNSNAGSEIADRCGLDSTDRRQFGNGACFSAEHFDSPLVQFGANGIAFAGARNIADAKLDSAGDGLHADRRFG